jgi:hypothetical protein
MQCTLLIPELFWPGATAETVRTGLELPALTRLLARASAEKHPPVSPEAWLCQAFEVERQQDWPVAPLTLLLDGAEPGESYWLRADPVHLSVARDRIALVESALFDLTHDEAQSLVAALNAHFADRGITFHALAPKRWYAQLAAAPRITTRNVSEAAGKDVQRNLPTGPDALAWHTLFNEAQMLLHAHPVNVAREAVGDPVVNSVWLWGGGAHTSVTGRHFSAVWSDDALAVALAAAAEIEAAALPADAATWRAQSTRVGDGRQSHLLVMAELASAFHYQDADAWRSRLAALEAHWFAPLLAALRERSLERLAIVAPCASACWRFEIAPGDLMRFWRRGQPLSGYA